MKIKKQMQKRLSLEIYRLEKERERERTNCRSREINRTVNLVLVLGLFFSLCCLYTSEMVCVVVFGDRRNRLLKRKLTGRMAVRSSTFYEQILSVHIFKTSGQVQIDFSIFLFVLFVL